MRADRESYHHLLFTIDKYRTSLRLQHKQNKRFLSAESQGNSFQRCVFMCAVFNE